MGERASMEGTKAVHLCMGDQEMVYEVWLAHIYDPCIGLDLLARWGAQIDVSRARLTIAAETMVLHPVLGGRARRNHCQMAAASMSTPAAAGSSTPAAGESSTQAARASPTQAARGSFMPAAGCPQCQLLRQ